jgi:hypothetical protein
MSIIIDFGEKINKFVWEVFERGNVDIVTSKSYIE